MPLAAISGMRLSFAPTSPARRPFDKAKPEPPAAISAGISTRKPHGMAVLTATTVECDPNSSAKAVDSQNVEDRQQRDHAGDRMDKFEHDFAAPAARFGYATQTPGTATFWNRCGEATAEDG